MGYSFKTNSAKSKATFLREDGHLVSNIKLQVSTRTLELYTNSQKQLFLKLSLRKNIFTSSFYQRLFFCQLGEIPAYLLAGDIEAKFLFFLT